MEAWKHLRAILFLPGMAAAVIPATIFLLTGLDTFGLWEQLPASRFVLPVVGIGRAGDGEKRKLVDEISRGWATTTRQTLFGGFSHQKQEPPLSKKVAALASGWQLVSVPKPILFSSRIVANLLPNLLPFFAVASYFYIMTCVGVATNLATKYPQGDSNPCLSREKAMS